jgi:hypothetical protein
MARVQAVNAVGTISGDAERYDAIDFGVYRRELAARRHGMFVSPHF